MADDTTKAADAYDRAYGALDGLPGGITSGRATVQQTTPLVGNVETWVTQAIRVPEVGETWFVQVLSSERSLRLVIPPRVVAALQRQHDGMAQRLRSRTARKAAATRAAGGFVPNTSGLRSKRGKKAARRPKAAK